MAPSATDTSSAASANSTVAPYTTGLAGVNQPMNLMFKDMLWWSLGLLALFVLSIRVMEIAWAQLRLVTAMASPPQRQRYWRRAQLSFMPNLKKYLIYAPLWKKRHVREIRLSSAVGIGTLPSRIQAVLLGIYLSSNVIYMFILNWGNDNKYSFCAEVRGRSGTLAAVNMVPLVILAGRNNPLIGMLRISFDTYNLLHRWMGRAVVIEVVIHAIAWMVVQVADGGWPSVSHKLIHESFEASGMVGAIALVVLMAFSFSPIRHAFYETFLNTHIILAFIIIVCTLVHCDTAAIDGGQLPQLSWIIAIVVLWAADRAARLFRVCYNGKNSRGESSEALVEPMPGECCRVTVQLPRYVDVKPGTHAYLRLWEVNPWECHPFSIAWSEHTPIDPKLPEDEKDAMAATSPDNLKTSVSFVIGAQTGFTRKLYNKARQAGTCAVKYSAYVEGPYAGHHSLNSYGHAVLIAGATGITHQISYLRPLIEGFNKGTVATRRITLVWIVRDYEALEWVRPWMDTILRLPNRKDILQIRLFVTRPKNAKQIVSASQTVQMFPGRPNIPLLIKKEVEEQIGAMAVTVCGPGALSDDVRAAVRTCQESGNVVDFFSENFTY